jgi:hypothetical protein
MVRHYFIGITVLLTTVFATLFAEKIQCKTGYDFPKSLSISSSYWSVLGFGSFVDNLIYQKLFYDQYC